MEEKKKRNRKQGKNREFEVVTYIFLAMFLMLIGYIVYFLVINSENFINNTYNKRIDYFSENTVRGKILAGNGTVLAETIQNEDGTETRSYPFANEYAHVVGFYTNGKTGIESYANFYLLRSNAFFLEKIGNDIKGEKDMGDNVVTTLDPVLQDSAYQALESYDGAVIVMEPSTGKILAMVSKPDYDPNNIQTVWEDLISDGEDSSLLNRATQGLYPPGSIFKILTTLEYIRENPDYESYHYDCSGSETYEGVRINCYNHKKHGSEDLYDSFANSCNSSFANLGRTLNLNEFHTLSDTMFFNQSISFELPTAQTSFTLKDGAGTAEIMETVIGQGNTLVTPLQMLMITSAIDNDGVSMKPYLVDRVENYKGVEVKNFEVTEYSQMMSADEAALMKGFMERVVTDGTAESMNGQSYQAYGKTGSAEFNEKGDSHSWFVGFASREDKSDIAVAVIMEGAGAGSTYAVPAAKKIFDSYYN